MTQQSSSPIFTSRQKRWGCWIIAFIWFVGTILLTVASASIMPAIATAFNVTGGWVTLAVVANAVLSFFVSGFIVAVGMAVFAGGAFVLLMAWAFFSKRSS